MGGDAYAAGVLARAARMLAAGITSAVNLLAPDAVVVMGGVAAAGDLFFGPLAAELGRPRFRSALDACTVVPGALPGTAGVVGAAGVFRLRTGPAPWLSRAPDGPIPGHADPSSAWSARSSGTPSICATVAVIPWRSGAG